MARRGYFDHVSPDGESPQDRVAGLRVSAENIAVGQDSARGVLDDWLKSDEHCMNMMNPRNTMIGVGYFPGRKYFWTQVFSAQQGATDKSCLSGGSPQFRHRSAPSATGTGATGNGEYKFTVATSHVV